MKEWIALAGAVARGVALSGVLVLLLPVVLGSDGIFRATPASEMVVCGLLLVSMRKRQQKLSVNRSICDFALDFFQPRSIKKMKKTRVKDM